MTSWRTLRDLPEPVHEHCVGNCVNDSPDAERSVNWTPTWTLRVCQMNCFADSSGNCPDASRLLRQPLCGHLPVLREMPPGNCSATARLLPGRFIGRWAAVAPDVARIRTGRSLVMDWMRLRTSCRPFASIGSDAIRPLPGCWPNNTRLLPGYFIGCCPNDSADDAPDILPDAARTLRGLRLYLQVRGWCLTKMTGFPIPESRPNHVRLNVSKYVRGCADENALNGRF